MTPELPVRLCCGQRHVGAECPDGLVMCCLCFERVPKEQLVIMETGCPRGRVRLMPRRGRAAVTAVLVLMTVGAVENR